MYYLRTIRYMQYACAFAASLMFASRSVSVTWGSPASSLIAKNQAPLTDLSDDEISLIRSTVMLGSIPGYFLSGFFADKFGRRNTLLFAGVPLAIPWYFVAYSENLFVVYAARFFTGVVGAIATAICSMYVAEISEEQIRGKASTLMAIIAQAANVYILSVGPFLPYDWIALSCGVLPLLATGLFCFMPESPYYLAKVGKTDKASASIKTLSSRNITEAALSTRIQTTFKYIEGDKVKRSGLFDLFAKSHYRRSLLITFGLTSLQVFSGDAAISSHTQKIMEESGTSISSATSSALIGIVRLPAVILLTLLVDKAGRKPLLVISCAGCCIALFGEASYFLLKHLEIDTASIFWFPTFFLMLYTIMFQLGLTVIPQIFLGELLATNIKGVAVSLLTFYKAFMNFLVIQFFSDAGKLLGEHVVFAIFGTLLFFGVIFILIIVPETKNKSLADIQVKLAGIRKKIVENNQPSS